MPVNDTLTPQEASYIASNSYFALKDWIKGAPIADVESSANVHSRVLGEGGKASPESINTTLKSTALGRAEINGVFSGNTGIHTTSGFGYVLKFQKNHQRHIVIATRGTRPELGTPDLLTDVRAAMTCFSDLGPVHKGFKVTFDSIIANLSSHSNEIMNCDVVLNFRRSGFSRNRVNFSLFNGPARPKVASFS